MIAADAPEALERFHSALDIVDRIANQTVRSLGSYVDKDELLAYGREGLLEAARRFDPSRGVPFRAYVNYRIRGAIYDGIRQASSLSRRMHEKLRALEAARQTSEGEAEFAFARPTESDATVEAAFDDHLSTLATAVGMGFATEVARSAAGEPIAPEPNAEEAFAQAELLSVVSAAISELFDDEREIVRRYYFEGQRMDDIAAALSMHKSWASRIHTRALARLTKRLRGVGG